MGREKMVTRNIRVREREESKRLVGDEVKEWFERGIIWWARLG